MAMKLKWQFGGSVEALEQEVNSIVGNETLENLLNNLPSEIPHNNTQTAQLTIKKLGDIVWQVSYMVYLDPKNRNFEKFSIRAVTEPSLRLALFEMGEELKKK